MNWSRHFLKYLKRSSIVLAALLMLAGCSLAPDEPVTRASLDRSTIYSRFVIEESPEILMFVLNKKGEAVVRATYRNVPIYLKVFATSTGLVWYAYPREQ